MKKIHTYFIELSEDIAKSWIYAAEKGVDFGDMSLKEFAKYYCRDNTKSWHRFFVSYRVIYKYMDDYYEMEDYR